MKDPTGHAAPARPDDAKPIASKDIQIELPGGTIVTVRIEIASVPKVGGGGTPMPGPAPGRGALLVSCLLDERFRATITADVSSATASISMGGGGTPHSP